MPVKEERTVVAVAVVVVVAVVCFGVTPVLEDHAMLENEPRPPACQAQPRVC